LQRNKAAPPGRLFKLRIAENIDCARSGQIFAMTLGQKGWNAPEKRPETTRRTRKMNKTLLRKFRVFLRSEDGAVTVDWVVLTAAIVSLGMLVGVVIWSKTGTAAGNIATFIGERSINTSSF